MTDVTDTTQLNTNSDNQTTTVIAVSAAVGVLGIILGLVVGIVATVVVVAVLLMRKKQGKVKSRLLSVNWSAHCSTGPVDKEMSAVKYAELLFVLFHSPLVFGLAQTLFLHNEGGIPQYIYTNT